MLKKAAYKLIDILTLGRGIKRSFEGNNLRMPTNYFRYFPKGYEKDNFQFINNQVRPGMTVLDIGSHIGLMAVIFGKKVGIQGKVYAFEPTPSTYNILTRTVKINNATNVITEPMAVAEKKGRLTFYISDNLADNSNSLVNNHRDDRNETSVDVEVTTVDDYVREKNIRKVDFIKVDVEGAECQLLKGAQQTLENHKPMVILAMHPESIKNFGDSSEEIWDLISSQGYSVWYGTSEMKREEFISRKNLFDVFLIVN